MYTHYSHTHTPMHSATTAANSASHREWLGAPAAEVGDAGSCCAKPLSVGVGTPVVTAGRGDVVVWGAGVGKMKCTHQLSTPPPRRCHVALRSKRISHHILGSDGYHAL